MIPEVTTNIISHYNKYKLYEIIKFSVFVSVTKGNSYNFILLFWHNLNQFLHLYTTAIYTYRGQCTFFFGKGNEEAEAIQREGRPKVACIYKS